MEIMLFEESAVWVVAKERLWLTAGRDRLVAEGDKDAAFLFVGAGKRFPRAEAERLGLFESAEVVAAEPDAPAEADASAGGLSIIVDDGAEAEVAAEAEAEPEPEAAVEPAVEEKPKPPAKKRRAKKGVKKG